jgi:hypothetical protein
VVSLWPITDANREAVEALTVTPDQGRFVSGVSESILEAAEEPDARALSWAIYASETARAARSRSTSDTASNEPEISTATRSCSGWRSPRPQNNINGRCKWREDRND